MNPPYSSLSYIFFFFTSTIPTLHTPTIHRSAHRDTNLHSTPPSHPSPSFHQTRPSHLSKGIITKLTPSNPTISYPKDVFNHFFSTSWNVFWDVYRLVYCNTLIKSGDNSLKSLVRCHGFNGGYGGGVGELCVGGRGGKGSRDYKVCVFLAKACRGGP